MLAGRCSICSGPVRLWGVREGYHVYQCVSCGHGQVDTNDLDLAAIDSAYAGSGDGSAIQLGSAEEYFERLRGGEHPGGQTFITTELVLNAIDARWRGSSVDVLEVGSGSGYLLQRSKQAGHNVVGVEPGPWGQVAAAKRDVHILSGYLEADSLTSRFDVVVAIDVIEHTPSPLDFIELLAHYLKPGGLLLLSFPNMDSLQAKLFRSEWTMVMPPGHLQFFTLKSITLALAKFDLQVLETSCFENTGLPYSFPYRLLRRLPGLVDLTKYLLNVGSLGDQRFICGGARLQQQALCHSQSNSDG